MQLSSHQLPIIPPLAASNASQNATELLTGAFSEFVSASARLEYSYEKLQREVAHLSLELADRNSALKASLEENERVHLALRQIVDSMPCGVLVVEEDGAVSLINPEGRKLLNPSDTEMGDIDAISAAAGVDLAGFLRRQEGAQAEREFLRISPHSKNWLAVHDRSLCGNHMLHDGAGRQTVLILRDVTLQKQAEEERERTRKAMALSEVATTLAHEIRNPLASLELFAGLVAQGGDDTGEWVSHLHAGIRSLSGTVNNVLSLHGNGLPILRQLDLEESIRSSVEFTRPIANQAGVRLLFDPDHELHNILGNSSALQQVVLNIVCNAIRHTDSEGTVKVSIRKPKSQPRSSLVEFSDTGSGIAPRDLADIFRAGFSVSGNTSGLGLAVCKQIVEQHNGELRVASTLGAGTTFQMEIPSL